MNGQDCDSEERMVAQLLDGVTPVLTMPGHDKQRVLAALQARTELAPALATGVDHAPR